MFEPDEPAHEESTVTTPAERALRLHARYRGKIEIAAKCPIGGYDDLSLWYTPGVAAPVRAIAEQRARVFEYTNRANTIAIVSDGSRVLGLGDVGPEAALPVMEGKALLFKYLGGVDAVPICLRTRDADEIVRTVELLEPTFGGINLEDIAQPKCFDVLARLRSRLTIPVWHDDREGTATVVLAALLNALEVVGKRLEGVEIVLVGCGAANVGVYDALCRAGASPRRIVAIDSKGALHAGRHDLDGNAEKARIACASNGRGVTGGIAEALSGADVCIAFSCPGPEVIAREWVRAMNRDAIVFACANPVPEIWPADALAAGARVVATGRSDFPNQINNALVFPGVFRGVLDVRARSISAAITHAAALATIACTKERGLSAERIVPAMDDPALVLRIAAAVARAAMDEGLAAAPADPDRLARDTAEIVARARRAARVAVDAGLVAPRR